MLVRNPLNSHTTLLDGGMILENIILTSLFFPWVGGRLSVYGAQGGSLSTMVIEFQVLGSWSTASLSIKHSLTSGCGYERGVVENMDTTDF